MALPPALPAMFLVELDEEVGAAPTMFQQLCQASGRPIMLRAADGVWRSAALLGEPSPNTSLGAGSLSVSAEESVWAIAAQERMAGRGDRLVAIALSALAASEQSELVAIRQAGGIALVALPTISPAALAQTLATYLQCTVPLPAVAQAAPGLSASSSIAPMAHQDELENLYDTIPIGLALVDPALRYIRANDFLGRIHGHESAAGYAGQLVAAVAPHLADKVLPLYQQVLNTGEPLLNIELRCPSYINPDVDSTYLVSYYPITQDDGKLCYISVSAVDVTELRRAEDLLALHNRTLAAQVSDRTAALQRSEDSFRMALRSSRLVGWQRNLATGETWYFGTFRSGGVWEATDWYLASNEFEVHPADRDWVQQAIDAAIAYRNELEIEYRLIFPDQSTSWVLSRGQVVSHDGKATHFFGTTLDVTSRKQAEITIREREIQLRNLAANLPGGIFQYALYPDGSDEFLYISPGSYELFELEKEPVVGTAHQRLQGRLFWERMYPEDVAQIQKIIQESAQTMQPWDHTWCLALPSGKVKWLQAQGRPTSREDGTVVWDAVILDVSDRKQTEIALREQEAYFRSLFEQSGVGIAVCDHDGRLVRVNQRYCELLGYSEAELLGCSYAEITFSADIANSRQALRDLSDEVVSYFSLEKRYLRKDGSTVWAHVTCSAIRDEQGNHCFTLGIIQDISERKNAMVALNLSEKRFRAIFQHAAIGVVIEVPPDYKLSLANAAYLRMLGYASEELAQLTYRDITVPEDLERQQVFIDECLAGKRSSYQMEKRYIRKDGRQIWVNMVTSVMHDESGKIEYYISVVEDITDRKRAIDLEISRHQALKEAIFEEATDAMFLVNPDTQKNVDCNRRAMMLFETDCKEVLLNRTGNSLYKHPYSDEELAEAWQQTLADAVWQREIEYLTCKGRSFWGLLSAKLIQVAEQRVVLVQVTDISDRKQVELNIRRNMEELQRLNEIKDDFLSTVSHELRSPLTSIDMAGRMIRVALEQQQLLPPPTDNPNAERIQHYLDILQDQCKQERELVNDLLDLQRLNANAYKLNMTEIDLAQWLSDITQDIAARAQENQQGFELAIAPNVTTLTTDAAVLRRVLTELLHNACKYTPSQQHIQLTVEAVPPIVQFTILNTGVTISPADQAQLFEPFFRVAQGDRWSKRGTGLGLTLVKKFVTCLQGSIQVASDAQITRFIVQLPPLIE